jgi:hypothetical protein
VTPLYEIGVAWAHAVTLNDPELRDENIPPRLRESRMTELLTRIRDKLRVRRDHFALGVIRGARMDEDFVVTRDDRANLAHPKGFAAPKARSRP